MQSGAASQPDSLLQHGGRTIDAMLTPNSASTSGEGLTVALLRFIIWVSPSAAAGCTCKYGLESDRRCFETAGDTYRLRTKCRFSQLSVCGSQRILKLPCLTMCSLPSVLININTGRFASDADSRPCDLLHGRYQLWCQIGYRSSEPFQCGLLFLTAFLQVDL